MTETMAPSPSKKADSNFSEDSFDLSKAGLYFTGETAEVTSNRPFQQTYQSILAVRKGTCTD